MNGSIRNIYCAGPLLKVHKIKLDRNVDQKKYFGNTAKPTPKRVE